MPSLQEITKTFLRLTRQARQSSPGVEQTRIRPGPREEQQYGAYRILRRLGAGGMGEVYLAVDTRLDRQVALKFLPPELTGDPAMLRRLQQEARTASALNHPNIVTIYEVAEMEDVLFIASEYIEGITLREALQRGPMELGRALDIAIQTASALMAAHSAGVIHRDLKPSNIMIRPDGYVKVIDFGIAKQVVRSDPDGFPDASFTRAGSVVGTLDYMSPEQARGERLDHRTDLWSLGIVLYEMVARKRPFTGQTESHVMVAILDKPVPPLPSGKSLKSGLGEIIHRTLTKDRAKRYQTAAEMLADLQRVSQASGFHTASRPIVIRPRVNAGRRLALTAGIVAAVAIAFAIWWWGFQGRESILGPNWFQFDSTKRVTFEGDVHLATIAPDGSYLVYVSGNRDSEVLRTRDFRTGSETQLSTPIRDCIGLTFSPDNKTVYYVLKEPKDVVGRLYSFKVPRSLPSLILEDIDGPITFAPDGQQFAYLRRSENKSASGDSIIIASASNSRSGRTAVTVSNTEMKEQLAWSPRGDSIAAIVFPQQLNKSTQPVVSLFTPDGRSERQFSSPDFRSLHFPVWLDGGSLLAFSGVPQGSKEMRLEQLFVPSGRFHQVPSDILGFDSISATADSRTLAAVRLELRSSIWIADSAALDNARKVVPGTERIDSLAWSNTGDLIFPSARRGNANLWRVDNGGAIHPVAGGKHCVEDEPSAVPGQSTIIYSSNCAGGDDFNLWSADLRTGRRMQLTSGSNYDYQPDVSPDGKWIVYTSWPSTVVSIWKLPVTGGAPARISQQQARYPAISPDGKQIACEIREPDGVWRVAILAFEDGTIRKEFPGLPVTDAVQWSPDGTALDYIDSRSKVPNIFRQPLRGGAPQQLTHLTDDGVISFAWSPDGSKLAYISGRAESDLVLFYRSSR